MRPDAALVSRFADQFNQLTAGDSNDRIGVAVSGGPDSVALLLLTAASFAGRVEAATVDHRLRATSEAEARFVADLCLTLGVPHSTLTIDHLPTRNLSAKAREARYAALQDWADARGIAWLLTAHHADDQLETIIMRLNRGAGVAGLSGIRARYGRIVRPLLTWRRNELVKIVNDAGITPVDDPTNRDDRYDRARLRKSLAQIDWIDPVSVAQSASALTDADVALNWSVDQIEALHVRVQAGVVIFDKDAIDLPTEYKRRIVLRCIARIDPDCEPRGEALTRTLVILARGGVTTMGAVLCSGGQHWQFSLAPPRRNMT